MDSSVDSNTVRTFDAEWNSSEGSRRTPEIYAVAKTEVAPRVSTYQELRRIHVSLGHCAQNTMATLLRAAHIQVDHQQLHELYRKCGCADSVYRITPPQVSCWMAKYNGEIVGVGIISPLQKRMIQKAALFTIKDENMHYS